MTVCSLFFSTAICVCGPLRKNNMQNNKTCNSQGGYSEGVLAYSHLST